MRAFLLRSTSVFSLKPEAWERHKRLRGGLVAGLFICSVLAAAKWYDWAHGNSVLYVPVLWTTASVLIVLVSPKRRILVAGCLFVYMFYSAKALLLHQEPRAALTMGIVAVILLAVLLLTTPSNWH